MFCYDMEVSFWGEVGCVLNKIEGFHRIGKREASVVYFIFI